MSYVVINAVEVPQERAQEFEDRFAARAGQVSRAPGFEAFELLRPANEAAGSRYLVYTRWSSRQDFEAWMRSPAFAAGHAHGGGAPVGISSQVWAYEVIQHEEPR